MREGEGVMHVAVPIQEDIMTDGKRSEGDGQPLTTPHGKRRGDAGSAKGNNGGWEKKRKGDGQPLT